MKSVQSFRLLMAVCFFLSFALPSFISLGIVWLSQVRCGGKRAHTRQLHPVVQHPFAPSWASAVASGRLKILKPLLAGSARGRAGVQSSRQAAGRNLRAISNFYRVTFLYSFLTFSSQNYKKVRNK